MARYQVQRIPNRRRGSNCGCLVVLMLSVLVIGGVLTLFAITNLPQITASLTGMQAIGSTDQVFAQPARNVPAVAVRNVGRAADVSVVAADVGTFPLDAGTVETGADTSGNPVAVLQISESDLNRICQRQSTICGTGNGRVRGANIDLRPDGLVITAEFLVPQTGLWIPAGAVARFSTGGGQLSLAGVDINGTLYTVPPNIASLDDLERVANDFLRRSALRADGRAYQIASLYADNDRLTVILR
ncbi:MAG TPA: hypothetical protein PKX07_04405 [Aggregatilineales bacterium]|nr:hypothetical protein [Aggregatilineales bacterium]